MDESKDDVEDDAVDTGEGISSQFFKAMIDSNYEEAERWLSLGADINFLSKGGSALRWAAMRGNTEAVEFLLANNADIHCISSDGFCALQIAAKFGQVQVADLLLKGRESQFADRIYQYGYTPLLYAADGGHVDMVQFLLKTFPDDLNRTSNNGTTPLMVAGWHGNLDIINMLLRNGSVIDINCLRESDGLSALDLARDQGHYNSVIFLQAKSEEALIRNLLATAADNDEIPVDVCEMIEFYWSVINLDEREEPDESEEFYNKQMFERWKELSALSQNMVEDEYPLEIKDRRWGMRRYKQCFVGTEFVDWLVENQCITREQARLIGEEMFELKIFHHVAFTQPFKDGYYFYRFQHHETEKNLRQRKWSGSSSTSATESALGGDKSVASKFSVMFNISSSSSSLIAPQNPPLKRPPPPHLDRWNELLNMKKEMLNGAQRQPLELSDRWYRFKTYNECFIGSKFVNWLVENRGMTRKVATDLGTEMFEMNLIHHVAGSQPFRDGFFFYRFLLFDEKSYQSKQKSRSHTDQREAKVRLEMIQIAKRIIRATPALDIRSRTYMFKTFKNCFVGQDFVDWLVDHKHFTRKQGITLGVQMFKHNVIVHVTSSQPFRDGYFFYRFQVDTPSASRRLHFLKEEEEMDEDEEPSLAEGGEEMDGENSEEASDLRTTHHSLFTPNSIGVGEPRVPESPSLAARINKRRRFMDETAPINPHYDNGDRKLQFIHTSSDSSPYASIPHTSTPGASTPSAPRSPRGKNSFNNRISRIAHNISTNGAPIEFDFENRSKKDKPNDRERKRQVKRRKELMELVFDAIYTRKGCLLEIKDRWHHFKTCEMSFVGSEFVDWLVHHRNLSRHLAVLVGQEMVELILLLHVNEKTQPFQDNSQYYRFFRHEIVKPSSTLAIPVNMKRWGQLINTVEDMLNNEKHPLHISERRYFMFNYLDCFVGEEFVEWLVTHRNLTKIKALTVGCEMYELKIFHHVTHSKPFLCGELLYRFQCLEGYSALNMQWIFPVNASNRCAYEVGRSVFLTAQTVFSKFLIRGVLPDYEAMAASDEFAKFEQSTLELQDVDITTLDHHQKLAFWCGIYNCLILHMLIIQHNEDCEQITKINRRLFDSTKYNIGRQEYSINDVQHLADRDPRVPFTLWCGSVSCPALHFFSESNVDQGLTAVTENYLQENVQVSYESGEIELPSRLKWGQPEFDESDEQTLIWICQFLERETSHQIQQLIKQRRTKITFKDHDWAILKILKIGQESDEEVSSVAGDLGSGIAGV